MRSPRREVVELAGISADELDRYRNPVTYASPESPVPQPTFDTDLPWQRGFPQKVYEAIISMPDEVVTKKMSENTPPVAVD